MCRDRTPYLSAYVCALLLLLSTGCGPAERNETGEIDTAGSVDAFAIHVGDCFDDQASSSSEVSDVPGVPCAEPHDNEVFATLDLPMSVWPGVERADELADAGCLERFREAIGVDYDDSVLVIMTMIPTEASWEQRKDREVICIAYHMDLDKLTGTVLNSGK